jgi:hypothetical protein
MSPPSVLEAEKGGQQDKEYSGEGREAAHKNGRDVVDGLWCSRLEEETAAVS